MPLHRRKNDRPAFARRTFHGRDLRAPSAVASPHAWLWGRHAVLAALANPLRPQPDRLVVTSDRVGDLPSGLAVAPEVLDAAAIGRLLPPGASHQGLALKVAPPEATPLASLAQSRAGVLVMLDKVTDPQNVGAIFRSAWAFGAGGVILQERHAPPLAGALAKAAAGAIDKIPHARVVNLSRALDEFERAGWRSIGLTSAAPESLAAVLDQRPSVLVVGAEGEGLRRLVSEHCDATARIDMAAGAESLNVAAAAAVALYLATRTRS